MIRRFGEAIRPDRDYTFRPGVYAILLRGGRILTTFQAEPDPELQLPGGGVDPGEQPIRALHREIYEETGWRVSTPRRLGAYRRFAYMPDYDKWAEKMCTVYVARPVAPLGPPTEPGHAAIWLDVEEAMEGLAMEAERRFLADLVGKSAM